MNIVLHNLAVILGIALYQLLYVRLSRNAQKISRRSQARTPAVWVHELPVPCTTGGNPPPVECQHRAKRSKSYALFSFLPSFFSCPSSGAAGAAPSSCLPLQLLQPELHPLS